jgi:4-amino-4-deoxy-L-arabinose transferase-like glycosyltransferase
MCASLALLLYLVGLGRPPLWEPDEGRYAEIAREMVVGRDYITPRDNFVPYFEKPPLVYWVTAASIRIFGRNEFAARLQAAIASAGQVGLTGTLGEWMFGATTGLLAALVLALSPLFFAFARFATPDPALAFFFTAAMACFYAGTHSSAIADGIKGRWIVAAVLMLALGTLTKGPVALLLGVAIAMFWLFAEGRSGDLFRMPWVKCIASYLALTMPWFILVARRNPGFVHFFVIHEHIQRYVESTEHSWGPWFYIPITIAGMWPWFFFIPFSLSKFPHVFLVRARGKKTVAALPVTIKSEDDNQGPALHLLIIWFAVFLIFFSIPRSKLGEYILPGLPPLAILAAVGFAQLEQLSLTRKRRLFMMFAAINAGAAIAVLTATIVVPPFDFRHVLIGDAIVAATALLVGGVATLVFLNRAASAVPLVLAISVIVGMSAGMDARERVAPFVSYRRLAEAIAPYANRGCRLVSYRHFEQALPFYTGAEETLVNYRGELEPFGPVHDLSGRVFATLSQLRATWAGEQCVVLVINRIDFPTLANLLVPAPTLIGREGKKLAVLNRHLGSAYKIIDQRSEDLDASKPMSWSK